MSQYKSVPVVINPDIPRWSATRRTTEGLTPVAEQAIETAFRWQESKRPQDINTLIDHFSPMAKMLALGMKKGLPAIVEVDDLMAIGNAATWNALKKADLLQKGELPIDNYLLLTANVRQRMNFSMIDHVRSITIDQGYDRHQHKNIAALVRVEKPEDFDIYSTPFGSAEAGSNPVLHAIIQEERVGKMSKHFGRLPERDQIVVEQYALNGRKLKSIAEDLKLTESGAFQIYQRVLTAFATSIGETVESIRADLGTEAGRHRSKKKTTPPQAIPA